MLLSVKTQSSWWGNVDRAIKSSSLPQRTATTSSLVHLSVSSHLWTPSHNWNSFPVLESALSLFSSSGVKVLILISTTSLKWSVSFTVITKRLRKILHMNPSPSWKSTFQWEQFKQSLNIFFGRETFISCGHLVDFIQIIKNSFLLLIRCQVFCTVPPPVPSGRSTKHQETRTCTEKEKETDDCFCYY